MSLALQRRRTKKFVFEDEPEIDFSNVKTCKHIGCSPKIHQHISVKIPFSKHCYIRWHSAKGINSVMEEIFNNLKKLLKKDPFHFHSWER